MKKINVMLFNILCVLSLCLVACEEEKGTTTEQLDGDERHLPEELEGLKVYSVKTEEGYVKVAFMDGKINSTTYNVDKTEESTILLEKPNAQTIKIEEVLMENDSMILCRKTNKH